MELDLEIRFDEVFKPTPRHRKWQHRDAVETVRVTVEEVSAAEAPVALVVHGERVENGGNGGFVDCDRAYLWYRDQLFTRCETTDFDWTTNRRSTRDATQGDITGWLRDAAHGGRPLPPNRDAALESLYKRAAGYLIVDGDVYEASMEPRYEIDVFGLGGNYGDTSVHVGETREPSFREPRAFSALERDLALETAVAVATERGDDQSLGGIHASASIEVLIPEAVRVPTREQIAERERERLCGISMHVVFNVSRLDGERPSQEDAEAVARAFIERVNQDYANRPGATVFLNPWLQMQKFMVEEIVLAEAGDGT